MVHPRFRAAYDFLVLRADAGEADLELAQWWTQIQEAQPEVQNRMFNKEGVAAGRRRRRRRRSRPPEPEES